MSTSSVNKSPKPDPQIVKCLNKISDARKLLDNNIQASVEMADTALEQLLRLLCLKNGADSSTEVEVKGKPLPFLRWSMTQYINHLESKDKIPSPMKAAFFKVHELRNKWHHHDDPVGEKLAERIISVVEYAIRWELDEFQEAQKDLGPEGGEFKLPRIRSKVVKRSLAKKWFDQGWYEYAPRGPNVELRHDPYKKWQKFEIRVRYLLERLGFQNCVGDIEDFHYAELGYQVDACGGSNGIFIVFDCISKNDPDYRSIRQKMKDVLFKEKKISKNIESLYPGRYHTKIFVICTEDIDVSQKEKDEILSQGLKLVDSVQVEGWMRYCSTLGRALRYHILKSISGFSAVTIDDQPDPFLHYRAFRLERDGKVLYFFLADPDDLLRLAYVYRLHMGNPLGYQRELRRRKISEINDFLVEQGNYFANNLILFFDSLPNAEDWPDFVPDAMAGKGASVFGTLHIPKLSCSAEVIDGQHRLYGYLDASDDQHNKRVLDRRRRADRLSVVAICDPTDDERPKLFADINSTQTKVDPRQLWVLMARVRAKSLMGFASQVVMGLNDGKVFRNMIHIPGVNRSGKRMNIANLGKGLTDRKLLHKKEEWNIYEGDRNSMDYDEDELKGPIEELERFFRFFKRSREISDFVFTNNGANVILRVFAQVKKYEHNKKKRFGRSELVKKVVRPVKTAIEREDLRSLLKRTSGEAPRGDFAKKIMADIRKEAGMEGFASELFS